MKPKYAAFSALDPFFEVVQRGLSGLVEGEHYFDTIAQNATFEFRYDIAGWPKQVESRDALMALYRGYGESIVLHGADGLVVHRCDDGRVVVIEYRGPWARRRQWCGLREPIRLDRDGRESTNCALARLHGFTVSHARPLHEDLTTTANSNSGAPYDPSGDHTNGICRDRGHHLRVSQARNAQWSPLGAVPALYRPHGLVGSGRCEWLGKRSARLCHQTSCQLLFRPASVISVCTAVIGINWRHPERHRRHDSYFSDRRKHPTGSVL